MGDTCWTIIFLGSQSGYCLCLQYCTALQSGSTNQSISKLLPGHPERPLFLDELMKICDGDFSVERQSIRSLHAELGLLPSDHANRSSCLLRLVLEDFTNGIRDVILTEQYGIMSMHCHPCHCQYLETLLGLCSSIYQRLDLLPKTF